jgi:hypothetical protein
MVCARQVAGDRGLTSAGESAFRQDEYEDAMGRLDDMGVKISVM